MLIAVLLGISTGTALAGTTGAVVLSGYIPRNCTISVSTTGNTGIDLSLGASRLGVAEVQENCNETAGYTVAVSSANALSASLGSAVFSGDTADNPDTMFYGVSYDNAPLSFVNGTATSARSVSSTVAVYTSPITISYSGDPTLAADSYSDLLNITMTVN